MRHGDIIPATWFCDFVAQWNDTALGYAFGVREDRQYRTAVNEEMNGPKSFAIGSASGSAHSEATQSRHYGKLFTDPTMYLSTTDLLTHRETSHRWHNVLGVDDGPLPTPRRKVFAKPELTDERVKTIAFDMAHSTITQILNDKLSQAVELAISRAIPTLIQAAVLTSKSGDNKPEMRASTRTQNSEGGSITVDMHSASQVTDGSSISTRNASPATIPSDPYTDGSSGGSFIDDSVSLPSPPRRRSGPSSTSLGKRPAVSTARDDSFEGVQAQTLSKRFKGSLRPILSSNTDDDDESIVSSPIGRRPRPFRRAMIPETSTEEGSSPAPVPLPTPPRPRGLPPRGPPAQQVVVISDTEEECSTPKHIPSDSEISTPTAQTSLVKKAIKLAFNDLDALPKSDLQLQALCAVARHESDVCVNLPTNAGKSLMWQIVPFMFPEALSVVSVTHQVLRAQHTRDAIAMKIRAVAFDPLYPPELGVQIVFVILEHLTGQAYKE